MEKPTVRVALPQDKEAIIGISKGVYSGYDYIPPLLDKHLTNSNKLCEVLELKGKIVGFRVTIKPNRSGVAWSIGLRIDENFRKQNLGAFFHENSGRWKLPGRKALCEVVDKNNIASQRLNKQGQIIAQKDFITLYLSGVENLLKKMNANENENDVNNNTTKIEEVSMNSFWEWIKVNIVEAGTPPRSTTSSFSSFSEEKENGEAEKAAKIETTTEREKDFGFTEGGKVVFAWHFTTLRSYDDMLNMYDFFEPRTLHYYVNHYGFSIAVETARVIGISYECGIYVNKKSSSSDEKEENRIKEIERHIKFHLIKVLNSKNNDNKKMLFIDIHIGGMESKEIREFLAEKYGLLELKEGETRLNHDYYFTGAFLFEHKV